MAKVIDFDLELKLIGMVKALKNLSPELLKQRRSRQSCYQRDCHFIASPTLDQEAFRREQIRREFRRSFDP